MRQQSAPTSGNFIAIMICRAVCILQRPNWRRRRTWDCWYVWLSHGKYPVTAASSSSHWHTHTGTSTIWILVHPNHASICTWCISWTANAVGLTFGVWYESKAVLVKLWLQCSYLLHMHPLTIICSCLVVQNVKVAWLLISICLSLEACCSLVVVTHGCVLANMRPHAVWPSPSL